MFLPTCTNELQSNLPFFEVDLRNVVTSQSSRIMCTQASSRHVIRQYKSFLRFSEERLEGQQLLVPEFLQQPNGTGKLLCAFQKLITGTRSGVRWEGATLRRT